MSQNGLSVSSFILWIILYWQAYITTDEEGNQITAFHPGAMSSLIEFDPHRQRHQHRYRIARRQRGMQLHADQFVELDIPFVFDPVKACPCYGAELLKFIDQATWMTLNDYESELMQERTVIIRANGGAVEALILLWAVKVQKFTRTGSASLFPLAKPKALLDPTGCGDAYRCRIVICLMNELDGKRREELPH